MYLPTALNKNARLNPWSEEVLKSGFFSKAKSILRVESRQTVRQLTKEEERAQGELFMNKLHKSNQTIGVQSFQGFTGGHILNRTR